MLHISNGGHDLTRVRRVLGGGGTLSPCTANWADWEP
jgi:hypothetical protein